MTERRQHGFYFILLFLFNLAGLIILTSAQDSNHFFCGTDWGDASGNCDEREHCPGGSDEDCSTEGHICFGGTTCDVRKGHGNKFKYANVDYGDISNTRFCGNGWNDAIKSCSIDNHCPSGFSEECPKGMSCYGGLKCNVQDLYEEEAKKKEELANAPENLNSIPRDDERRNMFCGFNWADASKKCSVWCYGGQDEECPGGQNCYGGTSCYAEMMPTQNPMYKPSNPPSTLPPVSYDDPANNRFCGAGWGMAMSNCSFETHCPSGSSDDCAAGHTCHGGLPSPQCNIVDIWEKSKKAGEPSPVPTMQPITADSPTNTKFCGRSWLEAQESCSLDTHCPDDKCPKGFVCYGGTKCNSFDMTEKPTQHPTLRPTNEPTTYPPTFTPKPTESPTDPLIPTSSPTSQGPTVEVIPEGDMRHSFWCGKDWADVNKKCHQPCTSGQDTECSDSTMKCIAFTNCRPTPKPTEKPTKKPSPQTPRPSLRPTEKLVTSTPKVVYDDFMCAKVYKPVCGSDGVSYPNDCEAKKAGVKIASVGECMVPVLAEQCSPGGRCSVEGSSCGVGKETCCGQTYDSLKCECSSGSWMCHVADACMMPCAEDTTTTTTSTTTAGDVMVTQSSGLCGKWHISRETPNTCTNSGVGTVEPTSSCTGWYKSGEECCRRYYGERDCHLVDVTARTTEATATALSCGTWHASRETPRSCTNSKVGMREPTSDCAGWYKSGEECCRSYMGRECPMIDVSVDTSSTSTLPTVPLSPCEEWHVDRNDRSICTNSEDYPSVWREYYYDEFFFGTADACCERVENCRAVDVCALCPELYAPVCGYDGSTYENKCKAEAAGIEKYVKGTCEELVAATTTTTTTTTPATTRHPEVLYDDFMCAEVHKPVCGSDGVSYPNDCEAEKAGVKVASVGECMVPVLAEQCSPGGRCSVEGSSCGVGKETCCGQTYDSLKCECSSGSWMCLVTDACMMPCAPTSSQTTFKPVEITTTTVSTSTTTSITHSTTPAATSSSTTSNATTSNPGDMELNSGYRGSPTGAPTSMCSNYKGRRSCLRAKGQKCDWNGPERACVQDIDDEEIEPNSESAAEEVCTSLYKKKSRCQEAGCVWKRSKALKERCTPDPSAM